MADYTGVRDAVTSMANLLARHITTSGEPVLTGVPVSMLSPHELELENTANAVSVWLHRVQVQPDLLNAAPPRPDPDHELVRPTPLELVCHVTALHPDAPTRMLLLGRIVQVVADHSRLAGADLAGGLLGSGTVLLLDLQSLSQYDLSLVWGTVHTAARPGVGVRISGLAIDTHLTPRDTTRVLSASSRLDQVVAAR
jgi:hypothetical protein